MIKFVNEKRFDEEKRKNPINEIAKIKQSLHDIDYLLQSTGKSTSMIWGKIQSALDSMDDVETLLTELP